MLPAILQDRQSTLVAACTISDRGGAHDSLIYLITYEARVGNADFLGAGFQPAAGRRPVMLHAGKMPALPGSRSPIVSWAGLRIMRNQVDLFLILVEEIGDYIG